MWDPGCIKNLQKMLALEFKRRSFWGFFPRGFLNVFSVGYIKPRLTIQTKKKQSSRNNRKVPKTACNMFLVNCKEIASI